MNFARGVGVVSSVVRSVTAAGMREGRELVSAGAQSVSSVCQSYPLAVRAIAVELK